jgi:hypothetical protein
LADEETVASGLDISNAAAQSGAILLAIIQVCRRLDITPFDHLKDALAEILPS